MTTTQFYETQLEHQTKKRKAAVEFIKIVSDLWYDNSVELILFRNQLIDRNVSEILNLLEYSREFVQKPISIFDAVEIAQEIKNLEITLAKIDIGKLVFEYHLERKKVSKRDFVKLKLAGSFTPNNFKLSREDIRTIRGFLRSLFLSWKTLSTASFDKASACIP